MNLYLIGYRGTGKTTVAPLLAKTLGRPWVDTDAEICRRTGQTVAEIFAQRGEEGFRELEELVLAEMARRDGLVCATGGGIILRPANRALLQAGFTVWLLADPAVLHQRLTADTNTVGQRPALTAAAGGLDEIYRVLARRIDLYREASDMAVDTTHTAPANIVERIVIAWEGRVLGLHDETRQN